jgi:hypothetical protein
VSMCASVSFAPRDESAPFSMSSISLRIRKAFAFSSESSHSSLTTPSSRLPAMSLGNIVSRQEEWHLDEPSVVARSKNADPCGIAYKHLCIIFFKTKRKYRSRFCHGSSGNSLLRISLENSGISEI